MLTALLIVAFAQPKVELDVVYAKIGSQEMKMDLYYPAGESKKPTPAIVVIHGGAWMGGNKRDMAPFAQEVAKRGFFAASVSYRLAPASKWPAMIEDVQTATRFIRSNASKYNIDPDRIGSAGASAGGHLALLLGFRETRDPNPTEFKGVSSRTQAVFNIFGPTDMANDFPPAMDVLFPIVLGKPKAEAADLIKDASPVHFVGNDSPPVFTIHGTADTVVPVKQASRLEDAMKAKGRTIETVIVEGMPHGVSTSNPDVNKKIQEGLDKGYAFMEKHLGLKPAKGR